MVLQDSEVSTVDSTRGAKKQQPILPADRRAHPGVEPGKCVAPETHNTAAAVPSTRMYLVRPETPDVESIDVTRLNLLKTGWFWTPDGRCASLG